MIPAKSCHYTTKFNSELHKFPTIFSIHRTLILFFPYSISYWAFQDPPCRHRCSKGSTILPHSPIWFVIYPLWFVNAAFCTSQHTTTVKNTRQIITFLPKLLHNSNKSRTFATLEPPSLLTMLKSGVVLFLYHHEIIVRQVFYAA